jgi:hypothetical protein
MELLRVIFDEVGGKLEKFRKSIGRHIQSFPVQELRSHFLENFTRKISIDPECDATCLFDYRNYKTFDYCSRLWRILA